MAKNKTEHYYRVTFVDRHHRRNPIDLITKGFKKQEAIDKAREALHDKALTDLKMITDDWATALSPDVWKVSPEYYFTMVDNCWSIADCSVCDQFARSVSSSDKVRKARWSSKQRKERDEKQRRENLNAA